LAASKTKVQRLLRLLKAQQTKGGGDAAVFDALFAEENAAEAEMKAAAVRSAF
jgi:hypothetical protein